MSLNRDGTSGRSALLLLLLLAVVCLAACGDKAREAEQAVAQTPAIQGPAPVEEQAGQDASDTVTAAEVVADTQFKELEWDDLIPADFRPDTLLDEYNANELSDDDPRAQELMEKLRELWKQAPVVEELDGRLIKLPGFVVPLEGDGEVVNTFLLVPYYGACIHVPPPPVNQTVFVDAKGKAASIRQLFDTVWVSGKLSVTSTSSELGDAGYTIEAVKVEPYE